MNKYVIEGKPIPLSRPRFYKGRVIDSQKNDKLIVSDILRFQNIDKPLYTGPLRVTLRFYFKKSKSYKPRPLGSGPEWHPKRPDLDNLIKFYLDAANDILYKDDAQIVVIGAGKVYSDLPRVEICIQELK